MDPQLSDLLRRWQERHADDPTVTLEQVCADCPEQLAALRQHLAEGAALGPAPSTAQDFRVQGSPLAPAEDPEVRLPIVGGRYQPSRFHARGGLGEVFVALDQELHREVAIKRLQPQHAHHPASRRRFLLEAEITGRLEHPGVVPVHGLQTDERGEPSYAMRFIQGESLADAIQRFHQADSNFDRNVSDRRMALRQLLHRFIAVCNTVAYAHSRCIVHRDLKPANIMLGKYGETLVMDWGLAKTVTRSEACLASGEETLLPNEGGDTDATLLGQVLGTPVYMSPEQAAGRWDIVREPSDIYSLGATLACLLAGQAPIQGKDTAEVLDKVRRGVVVYPRQANRRVPNALDAICRKAMALEPSDRYGSVQALAADVERWLAGEEVTVWREPWPERARRWLVKHRVLAGSSLVALVLGIAALAAILLLVDRQRKDLASKNADLEQANHSERVALANAVQAQAEERHAKDLGRRVLELMLTSEMLDQITQQREGFLTPERQQLLKALMSYYRDLVHEDAISEEERFRRAEAHARIGRLLVALGQMTDGVKAYDTARELLEKLVSEVPAAPNHRQRLADICNTQARLLTELSEHARALAVNARALELLTLLAGNAASPPQQRLAIAVTYNIRGLIQIDLGRRSEAVESFYRAIQIEDQLAAKYPEGPRYRMEAASTRNNLGLVLRDLGQRLEAERAYREALPILQKLVTEFPQNREYRWILSAVSNNLGIVLASQGQRAEAEQSFRRALTNWEQLAAEAPGRPRYRLNVASSCLELGSLSRAQGQWTASLEWFQKATDLLAPLVAQEPKWIHARANLRSAHWGRAQALVGLGRHREAAEALNRALELAEGPERATLRLQRAFALLRSGQPPPAIAEVESLIQGDSVPATTLYDAACLLALASAQEKVSDSTRIAHADRAVVLLRRAQALGLFGDANHRAHLKQDPDLDSLRHRPDFQKLVTDLERPSGPAAK